MSKDSPMEKEFQRIAEQIANGGGNDFDPAVFNNLPLPVNGFADDHDHGDDEEYEIALTDLPIRPELLDGGGLTFEATIFWPGSDETETASLTHGESTHALFEYKGDAQWQFTSSNLNPIELLAILKQLSETIEENLEELDEQWDARLEEIGGEIPAPIATDN